MRNQLGNNMRLQTVKEFAPPASTRSVNGVSCNLVENVIRGDVIGKPPADFDFSDSGNSSAFVQSIFLAIILKFDLWLKKVKYWLRLVASDGCLWKRNRQ